MYNLFNKLFGWKYVVIRYGYNDYVRRIRTNSDGIEYVVVYGDYLILNDFINRVVLRLP